MNCYTAMVIDESVDVVAFICFIMCKARFN